jgi:hypothetical protein
MRKKVWQLGVGSNSHLIELGRQGATQYSFAQAAESFCILTLGVLAVMKTMIDKRVIYLLVYEKLF